MSDLQISATNAIPLQARRKEKLHGKLVSLVNELFLSGIDLQFAKQELESIYIQKVLKQHKGNIGASAHALGMHRNTLSKRIRDLDIPAD